MLWVSESLCIIIIVVCYVKGAQLMCTCILVLLRVSDIQFLERGKKYLYTYMYRLHKVYRMPKKSVLLQ